MGISLNEKEEKNYQGFIKDLEKISKKYGIAIEGCGLFTYYDLNGFKNIEYSKDSSSGDIWVKKLTYSDGEEARI